MKKVLSLLVLIGVMMPIWVSCSSDDDEVVDINSYIVGTWHSYKAIMYYEGETEYIEVTNTGQFKQPYYYEIEIKSDGTLLFSMWRKDEKGQDQWTTTPGRYVIKGDIVYIAEPLWAPKEFVFECTSKVLCLPSYVIISKYQGKGDLYFKKK